MFTELRKYIDEEIEPAATSTSAFLRKLNGARTRLRHAIDKSNEQVKLIKNEKDYVAQLKPQIERDARKISKDILFNKILEALRTNKEFDNPVYRLPLYEALEDDGTYLVRITGTGFNSKISVDINLDRTAGRLNMWAAAIKAVRAELGVVVPRRDSKNYRKKAIAASMAWRRLYFAGGTDETVENRIAIAAKPAPFWSILNFGTPAVGQMPSDRGGFSTPKNKPTNFVDKAEQEIKSAVAGFLSTAKEKHQALFDEYNKFLNEALDIQAQLDEMAINIRLDLKVVRRLERQLELEVNQINRGKLEKAVDDIRRGLLTGGRVDITARGSRRRTRISVSTLMEYL